jgi:hypothetical protein
MWDGKMYKGCQDLKEGEDQGRKGRRVLRKKKKVAKEGCEDRNGGRKRESKQKEGECSTYCAVSSSESTSGGSQTGCGDFFIFTYGSE